MVAFARNKWLKQGAAAVEKGKEENFEEF